jgi:hypothetical protein
MSKIKLFPWIITLAALVVSLTAAFYSVSGLSQLFAGAGLAVAVMAGGLEFSKLVIASLLYQYRKNLPKFLKTYLTTSVVVLILITSMGIYGFLSASYEQVSQKSSILDNEITLLESKKNLYQEQLASYNEEKSSSTKAMLELRSGLSNNTIQYKDAITGQIISTTSSANRKSLENQLNEISLRNKEVNTQIDTLNNRIFGIENQILETKTNSDLTAELGPLRYIAKITGVGMDYIVNILILIIIFVFDPLAIALVISANFAFAQGNKPKYGEEDTTDYKIYQENEPPKETSPPQIVQNSDSYVDNPFNPSSWWKNRQSKKNDGFSKSY